MTAGYQSVQGFHSLAEFSQEHPEIFQSWHRNSKYITFLATKDENHLKYLIGQLSTAGIKISIFCEPDIHNQVTAIAIEPSEAAFKLCSSIPLALKEYNAPNLINKHSVNGKEVLS